MMGKPRPAPIRAADAVAATNVWRTDPRHMAMRARILADDLGSGIYPTDWFVDNGITVLVARLLRGTDAPSSVARFTRWVAIPRHAMKCTKCGIDSTACRSRVLRERMTQ